MSLGLSATFFVPLDSPLLFYHYFFLFKGQGKKYCLDVRSDEETMLVFLQDFAVLVAVCYL